MLNKIEKFSKELVFIKNTNIRKFTEKVIEDLPEYFFEIPASSTGKYHPSYSLGIGGLLRHTRAAMRIAVELFRIYDFTENEKDLILASLAVHDGHKSGLVKSTYTVAEHPIIQTFAMKQNEELKNLLPENEFNIICENIDTHMGQWNKDYKTGVEVLPKPVTRMQKFVHLVDYLASRKCLEMNFDIEIIR